MWYDEVNDPGYSFQGEETMGCGHFSQVVWVNTNRAGFAFAKTADGNTIYAVGQYGPAGNYDGEWKENVLPPTDGRKDLFTDSSPELTQ